MAAGREREGGVEDEGLGSGWGKGAGGDRLGGGRGCLENRLKVVSAKMTAPSIFLFFVSK